MTPLPFYRHDPGFQFTETGIPYVIIDPILAEIDPKNKFQLVRLKNRICKHFCTEFGHKEAKVTEIYLVESERKDKVLYIQLLTEELAGGPDAYRNIVCRFL